MLWHDCTDGSVSVQFRCDTSAHYARAEAARLAAACFDYAGDVERGLCDDDNDFAVDGATIRGGLIGVEGAAALTMVAVALGLEESILF